MRSCAHCGESGLPERSRYCLACGVPFASPADTGTGGPSSYTPEHLLRGVLTTRSAREGERKDVTVVVADVAASLAMAAALDPEDVHAVMDGFFALALEVVNSEGGTINQFRGDGFMALFGAPRARGDDAARALRAALEIRRRASGYSESVQGRFGIPLVLRVGIQSGLVWVGAIGTDLRRDYTAEGTTVGTAARLEESAAPGQILVGGETVRRCADLFTLADLGERSFRGLGTPVRVFELLEEGRHVARFDVEQARGLAPFVGREHELDDLARAASLRPGIQCVEVTGEPGVGKSRLVHEYLARLPSSVTIAKTWCREPDVHRAYVPWLGLLCGWPGPSRPELEGLIASLEGRAPAAAGEIQARLHELLATALAVGPVLLVFEDVQWLDPSSRAVFRWLAADSAEGSLVVLGTRREDAEADWCAPGSAQRIALEPLSTDEARKLARSLLGESAEYELLAELAAIRSGGNPLFVEELSRALREGSEEMRSAARLELALHRAPLRIPETLAGVVASRIDALPDDSKRLLQIAAVFGEPFEAELLHQIELGEPERLAAGVDDLLRSGLLQWGAGGKLEFRHQLVREAAYHQLVREQQRALHAGAAEALAKGSHRETVHGQSRIGTHYDRAGDAKSAIVFLSRAGRGYLHSLNAPREAATHLRRAFELLQASDERDRAGELEVGLHLASALNALDQTGEVAAILESIEPEPGCEDRLPLAAISIETGWIRFSEHNELDQGRRLVSRGLALSRTTPGAERVVSMACNYLCRMDILDGRATRAARRARRMVELAAGRGDRAVQVVGLHNEAAALCDLGRLEAARSAALEAVDRAREGENEILEGLGALCLAKVYLFEGEAERARTAADLGWRAGERSGQIGLLYHATVWKGYARSLGGDPRGAFEEFERLAELNARWPNTSLHRARGHLGVGDVERASELAGACLSLGPPALVRLRALVILGLALGLSKRGDEKAVEFVGEAASLSDDLGLRPYRAEAREALAELHLHRGDVERASYYATRAAEDFDASGMRAHARRASLLLAG